MASKSKKWTSKLEWKLWESALGLHRMVVFAGMSWTRGCFHGHPRSGGRFRICHQCHWLAAAVRSDHRKAACMAPDPSPWDISMQQQGTFLTPQAWRGDNPKSGAIQVQTDRVTTRFLRFLLATSLFSRRCSACHICRFDHTRTAGVPSRIRKHRAPCTDTIDIRWR